MIMLLSKNYMQAQCNCNQYGNSCSWVPTAWAGTLFCDNNPYQLMFEDNFDGNSLDTSIWKLQPWGNGTQGAYYSLDNAVVSNGTLNIVAKRDTVVAEAVYGVPTNSIMPDGLTNLRTYYYSSSNIWTKFEVPEGKFEARIKIPKGKGFFPAFWLYSDNPWDEIDIFEFNTPTDILGHYDPSKLSKVHHMNIHHDFDHNGKSDDCSDKYTGVDFSQDYHIFGLEWEKDKIIWYVDGNVVRNYYRFTDISGSPAFVCDIYPNMYLRNQIYIYKPMAIMLNLAVQTGTNAPDGLTPFPSQMEVDWLRYYKKMPCGAVNLTNANTSNYLVSGSDYNLISGTYVNVNCTYTIQAEKHLTMVARDSIDILPGFNVASGSRTDIFIDPTNCGSSARIANIGNLEILETSGETNIDDKGIRIFPNPNEGIFTIDFGVKKNETFDIIVTNIYGEIVFFEKRISAPVSKIDLTGKAKGVYVLQLTNTENKSKTVRKIIVQ